MESLEKELYDLVTFELNELAWCADFPVNSNIGIWCFLQGFRDKGFDVTIKDKQAILTYSLGFTKDIDDTIYSFRSKLSFDEILKGWDTHPKSSPHSLYDSICESFDRMGEGLKDDAEKRNVWSEFRHNRSKEVREKMENHLLPFFAKYQEHMLVPVLGKMPELKEPKLFYKVLEEYPIHVFRNSGFCANLGPIAEVLPDMDWDFNIADYHPSKSTMLDYFWGKYLDALSKHKGYPLRYESGNEVENLKQLLCNGSRAFVRGSDVWPNKYNKNSKYLQV